jgi:hypothetical protein
MLRCKRFPSPTANVGHLRPIRTIQFEVRCAPTYLSQLVRRRSLPLCAKNSPEQVQQGACTHIEMRLTIERGRYHL